MARRGCSERSAATRRRYVRDDRRARRRVDREGRVPRRRRRRRVTHPRASLRRRSSHPRASLRRRSSLPRVSRGVGRGEGISRGYGPFDVAFKRPGHGGALRARRGGPAGRVREVIGRAVPPRGDPRREGRGALRLQGRRGRAAGAGTVDDLFRSLQKLKALPPDTIVLPAHHYGACSWRRWAPGGGVKK